MPRKGNAAPRNANGIQDFRLEVKGFETEQDRQKEAAAQRWVRAVNHHGEFGRWVFLVCRNPGQLPKLLAGIGRGDLRA